MESILRIEWDFAAVPDDELLACCYWEYARESAFVCGLRQRCWEYWKPRLQRPRWWNEPEDGKTHQDMQKGLVSKIYGLISAPAADRVCDTTRFP
jgi:hypothetical protein